MKSAINPSGRPPSSLPRGQADHGSARCRSRSRKPPHVPLVAIVPCDDAGLAKGLAKAVAKGVAEKMKA